MKKNIQKLKLNKKSVSNLTEKLHGGFRRADKSNGPLSCTRPTPNTMCYHCPPDEPL